MSITAAFGLTGRTAIVTGASSGHGRAIALELAARGAYVVCSDLQHEPRPGLNTDQGLPTDELIRERGGQSVFARADVASSEDLEAAVTTAVDQWGRLDIMINNAGIFTGLASIVDETEEAWARTIDINLSGVWRGCRAAIRQMSNQEPVGGLRGRIVNTGSVAGMMGQPDITPYSTAKGGVINLTRALAAEWAREQIIVNTVSPGYTRTAMNEYVLADPERERAVAERHPMGVIGTPEDIAYATAFLASDQARWITGVNLPVDAGLTAV